MKTLGTVLAVLLILSSVPLAVGQQNVKYSPDPEIRAGYAIGTYLAAIETARALKATECGYVMNQEIPDINDVLRKEILPIDTNV